MFAIATPVAVEVSTAQSSATNAQPCRCAFPIRPVKSIFDLLKWSSFATTSAARSNLELAGIIPEVSV
jgi:hypothetical protein